MNRILFHAEEVSGSGRVVLTDKRADHIRNVLCASLHDTLRVGILDGPCGEGEVLAIDRAAVELECRFKSKPPPFPSVDLLLAMPRPKVMKRLWAPLASLGVGRIIITNAARVERNYFDTHWLNPTHYTPLLVEGLQQAGTTRLPAVSVVRRFRPFLEDRLDELCPDTHRIVAHPRDAAPYANVLAAQPERRLVLAIGPEGGWVPFELELMQRRGFQAVRLPCGALRTDVACIALLAVVAALRGEGEQEKNTLDAIDLAPTPIAMTGSPHDSQADYCCGWRCGRIDGGGPGG